MGFGLPGDGCEHLQWSVAAYGYGDVSHGFSWEGRVYRLSINSVRQREETICKRSELSFDRVNACGRGAWMECWAGCGWLPPTLESKSDSRMGHSADGRTKTQVGGGAVSFPQRGVWRTKRNV